ncbi:hypothetical protein ABVT39_020498 [Epinephelus coioides]
MAEVDAQLMSLSHLKANVWWHYGFKKKENCEELDKNNAVCTMCKVEVNYNGNTTNLRSHLTRHHPERTQQQPGNNAKNEFQFNINWTIKFFYLITATLLSPEVCRNKRDLCTLTEADVTVAENIVKALQPLKQEDSSLAADPPTKRSKEPSSALMSLLGSVYKPKEPAVPVRSAPEKAQDYVKGYREVDPLPLSENPLSWWMKHEASYPLLAHQAKRLCAWDQCPF